ncbi:MAG TPA: hypothetical protein VFW13_02785 [Phenylobacterium sp.]|nr:hypothetical protein [Phenylobacterium sp.]
MRPTLRLRATLATVAAATGLLGAGLPKAQPAAAPLQLCQTIVLPDVNGGFDLMAIDLAGKRLFVDAEDNNTTEVLDVAGRGRWLARIPGMTQPKWAVYRPELNKLYIANGDGVLKVLDGRTYALKTALKFPQKTNNLRYDAPSHALLVGVGDTMGQLAVVDAKTDAVSRTIPLASFPKQFEIAGDKVFINVPAKSLVQVVDWKRGVLVTQWSLPRCENVPMDLDRAGHRLLIGCTQGELLSLDTRSGQVLSRTPIDRDADGVHFDASRRRVYVTAGEGAIDVLQPAGAQGFERQARIPTRPGAGTSILVPQLQALFVALPQRGAEPAEVRGYHVAG